MTLRRACYPGIVLLGLLAGCREGGTTDHPTTTATGAGGAGGSVPAEPLVVATWNVKNLFNDLNDSAASQEWIESPAVWDAHRQAVGAVLAGLDADIVVFQELENEATLDELIDTELGAGAFPHRVVSVGNDPRGVNVAVASNVPFDEVVSHASETFTKVGTAGPIYQYARDALEVHLTFNGRQLVLFGVHYKAKENDDPDKRLAEAQHTRALADAIIGATPATGALIIGDFNDTPGSLPYEWTLGDPPTQYANAADHVAAADRWTFDYQGSPELVDQQFASPLLASMVDPASVTIPHGTDIEAASDHSPLVATYLVH